MTKRNKQTDCYSIKADSLQEAIIQLVEQFKVNHPYLGAFACTLHDGTKVSIRLKPEKAAR